MTQMVVKGEGLKRNYYALYLSIAKKKSVKKSCICMGLESDRKEMDTSNMNGHGKINWPDSVYEEVIINKNSGMTWEEIADGLGVIDATLQIKVKRYMGGDWENREWR